MMGLPEGWRASTLDELRAPGRSMVDGPFGSNLKTAHYTESGPQVVRLQNIGEGIYRDAPAHISEEHFERLGTHEVLPGDLLVASLGEVLPRACLMPGYVGPAIVKADCIRVRLSGSVDPRWVMYSLLTPETRRWAEARTHGVGRPRLGLRLVRQIPVPLPPLDEQRRVVEILEEHLSHLDAAHNYLMAAERRAELLLKVSLWEATHDLAGAKEVRLDSVSEVRLGRQRSPKNHSGERMRPYLRAANVDWDGLRLDDVNEMNFSKAEETVYRLEPGDILLTEASGSAAEVGKSAMYEGLPANVCFQNTLLRVRCHSADPHFVQKYLLAEAMAGKFMPESRGVGINHLGRRKLANLTIKLPDERQQRAAIEQCHEAIMDVARLRSAITAQKRRAASLRRALLAAAFSGQLTGAASDTERVEELAEAGV